MKHKKSLSPVIATVLLVAMVIVIGLIIFLWFKGFIKEEITKFSGKNVRLVCDDVQFDASYSSSNEILYISNSGNVPIFSMKVEIFREGSHETEDIKNLSTAWPGTGLNQGQSFSGSINAASGANKITLIPVLIGSSERGQRTYVCEERHGFEISIN